MSNSHTVLKFFRSLHLYLGVFLSPALLFFAFTGAIQTFSLHETTQGKSYKPAAWLVTLGQIHKKQTTDVPVRKAKPEGLDGAGAQSAKADRPPAVASAASDQEKMAKGTEAPQPRPKSHLPMKIFFLLVALGLFTSTLSGIYMAYRYKRNKVAVTGLLVAGVVVPLLLLPW